MAFVVLALSIVFILVAIVFLRLHPFLALIVAAMLVGLLSPRPLLESEVERAQRRLEAELSGAVSEEELTERLETVRWQVEAGRRASNAVLALELTASGFGSTAAGIGIVIVLAAIIGQCLMESGAADRIVRRLLSLMGERRAGLSLMGSGYLLSIPVFFDTVFFLLVPLARTLRLRTGAHYVLYVIAICGGAVITHSLVPPTPGPLLMADTLGLDLGVAIVGGLLLGIVPAGIGLWFGHWVDSRLQVPFREVVGSSREELETVARRSEEELPGLLVSLAPVLLPVVLISGASLVELLARQPGSLFVAVEPWASFWGNKNLALLLAAVIAAWTLKRHKGLTASELGEHLGPAITSAGVIILITCAGGAFGSMLSRIGIDQALRDLSRGESGASHLLLAFGIASAMKIAQGSGTVSIITTAGIMSAILPASGLLPYHLLYVYAAIGFGSGLVSWMNDSGFWVVCKMGGLTEKETLQTWTLVVVVIGLVGLVEVLLLSAILPLV